VKPLTRIRNITRRFQPTGAAAAGASLVRLLREHAADAGARIGNVAGVARNEMHVHMRAALKAQINKADRNDARGIAQMMRAGLYRPVHVKTLRSEKLRMLLAQLHLSAIIIETY